MTWKLLLTFKVSLKPGNSNISHLKFFSNFILNLLWISRNPNISEACIEKFTEVICKLDNLLNFDLYFRKYFPFFWIVWIISFRLNLPPRGILELGRRIQFSSNVQCSCGKESIHIYKRSQRDFTWGSGGCGFSNKSALHFREYNYSIGDMVCSSFLFLTRISFKFMFIINFCLTSLW